MDEAIVSVHRSAGEKKVRKGEKCHAPEVES
jgi:hypothetical protein